MRGGDGEGGRKIDLYVSIAVVVRVATTNEVVGLGKFISCKCYSHTGCKSFTDYEFLVV